jgi:hypothetical protein
MKRQLQASNDGKTWVDVDTFALNSGGDMVFPHYRYVVQDPGGKGMAQVSASMVEPEPVVWQHPVGVDWAADSRPVDWTAYQNAQPEAKVRLK